MSEEKNINTITTVYGVDGLASIKSVPSAAEDAFCDFAKVYLDGQIPIINGKNLTQGSAVVRIKDSDSLRFLVDSNGRLYMHHKDGIENHENYYLNKETGHLIMEKF